MTCPKCGSENVTTQMVSETQMKRKRNPIYYIFIGWWVNLFMWLVLTIPMLFYKIFKPKKYKMKTKHKTMAVCQNCGKSWAV